MYNYQKIGVGLLTYNRKDLFKQLFDTVKSIDYIDEICIVKNKDINYGEMFDNLPSNVRYINVKDDLGIGYCKNQALIHLLETKCDHIFLIEDDIKIKNSEVFKVYIDTAKAFNLEHLNFCRAYDNITKQYLFPYLRMTIDGHSIEFFKRLCGDFQYFTKTALYAVGIFDDQHYVNALEHAEHTYRLIINNMYSPYGAFADIANSTEYLEDLGVTTSIIHNDNLYNTRLITAINSFKQKYGYGLNQIRFQSNEYIQNFIMKKINHEI